MAIILTLLFFVILLIFISVSNSLLYIALRLVTGEKIEEKKLILPSFLNFLLLLLFITLSYFILSSISIKGVTITFMNLLFKATSLSEIFLTAILPIILVMISCFLLSTFTLLTVNTDYNKVKGNIRIFFKKIFKKNKEETKKDIEENNNNNNNNNNKDKTINTEIINYNIEEKTTDEILDNSITLKQNNIQITYLNSLIANIFIISLVIFTFTIFFFTGYLLSDVIMKIL